MSSPSNERAPVTQALSDAPGGARTKRPYEAPKLTVWGSVEESTGSTGSGTSDGGSFYGGAG